MIRHARIATYSIALSAIALIAAAVSFGLPFASEHQPTRSVPADPDASYEQAVSEDGAVFAALLLSRCRESGDPFVISVTPTHASEDTVEHTGLYREAKLAMLRRSADYFGASQARKGDRILVPPECKRAFPASEAQIRSALSEPIAGPRFKDRPAFQRLFPGASSVIWLSMPGYSQDGRHAVVYISGGCGHLCGSGFSIELEKTRAGWTEVRVESAWIS